MSFTAFYRKTITVTRVYGIPVRIDYRWFVVFALSVWLIATNLDHGGMWVGQVRLRPVGPGPAWLLGIVTTVVLFLSVFGHELSHALMGRAEGIEIEEIVLHPFGGLARLRNEPQSPGAEFRIAVAGPAASFLFAVAGYAALFVAMMLRYELAAGIFFLVASGNLLIAVFNLFPGYPLDGGRVLRAILWRRGGNIGEATRKAGLCGILIAVILMLFGVYMAFAPHFRAYFMGLWAVLVGLFLLDAALGVVRHGRLLSITTVSEAMGPPVAIEPNLLISSLVDNVLPLHRHTSFPVALNRRLHGILTLADLKSLPPDRWRVTRAAEVMRPVGPGLFVDPATSLAQASDLMRTNGVGSVAVVNPQGELVGYLQSGRIIKQKAKGKL
jgi:Zn-dependent protease